MAEKVAVLQFYLSTAFKYPCGVVLVGFMSCAQEEPFPQACTRTSFTDFRILFSNHVFCSQGCCKWYFSNLDSRF